MTEESKLAEDAFIIRGGNPLRGTIHVSGAKNVALKIVIAALLFKKPITLHNIPQIRDIHELLKLIQDLGAKAEFVGENTVLVDSANLNKTKINLLFGSKIRTSFMFFAPLLHVFQKASIPNPGGCRIGARPIDRHIDMLKAFGVSVEYDSETGYYHAISESDRLEGADFTFSKPSHTGTELALMLGVLAKGKSTIHNAAQEPEVDDLIQFLNQSGAHIQRNATKIEIDGIEELDHPQGEYTIMTDRLNAATYGAFAIATKGDVFVEGADPATMTTFLEKLEEVGGGIEIKDSGIRFYYKGPLKPANIVTTPHPGFNTDMQAPWACLMTQAEGESTIHETVYENRFGYVSEFRKLGAEIEFYQPEVENPLELYQFNVTPEEVSELQQGIKIKGPVELHNGVINVTDIRAGIALVIVAAVAEGESVITGAHIVDRGYEKIETKLRSIGADIRRV